MISMIIVATKMLQMDERNVKQKISTKKKMYKVFSNERKAVIESDRTIGIKGRRR